MPVLVLPGPFKDPKGQWEPSWEACDFRVLLLPFFPKLSRAEPTRARWGRWPPGGPSAADFQPSFSSFLSSSSHLPYGSGL